MCFRGWVCFNTGRRQHDRWKCGVTGGLQTSLRSPGHWDNLHFGAQNEQGESKAGGW